MKSFRLLLAGNDFRDNGRRAWSSYFEAGYPFAFKGLDMKIEAGLSPWSGMYCDRFNVVNIGFSVNKELNITPGFNPSISGKLIANPSEKQLYFVFGVHI